MDLYNKTGTTKVIVLVNFEGSELVSILSSLEHELTHETARVVFKGKTSVTYSSEYGLKCSKNTYVKAYSVFEKDLKFIKNSKGQKKKVVEEDGEYIFTIDKSIAPSGNELVYTKTALKLIFTFSEYLEHTHEEAVAFYTQAIATNIPSKHMTFMNPIGKYFDTCIVPAIEQFTAYHENCHLMQGIGACATQDPEL